MIDRLRFTKEMAQAGQDAFDDLGHNLRVSHPGWEQIFRAMLAAAPQEEYRDAFNEAHSAKWLSEFAVARKDLLK
jgi:hypothetical protein